MSPLFHRDGNGSGGQEPGPGHLPSLYELGPRLDEVVNNVAALPPEQFAAQLVTEALPLLQNAGLVMQRSYKVNQDHAYSQWLHGVVTTRRGRAALADGTVGQILGRVYTPPA